jgi:hypothetical protein
MEERIEARHLLEEIRGDVRYSNVTQFIVEVESTVSAGATKEPAGGGRALPWRWSGQSVPAVERTRF